MGMGVDNPPPPQRQRESHLLGACATPFTSSHFDQRINGCSTSSMRGRSRLISLMLFLVKRSSLLFIYVITTIVRTRILLFLIWSGSASAFMLKKIAHTRALRSLPRWSDATDPPCYPCVHIFFPSDFVVCCRWPWRWREFLGFLLLVNKARDLSVGINEALMSMVK